MYAPRCGPARASNPGDWNWLARARNGNFSNLVKENSVKENSVKENSVKDHFASSNILYEHNHSNKSTNSQLLLVKSHAAHCTNNGYVVK